MFSRAVTSHVNFLMIIQYWLQFSKLHWQFEKILLSNITAACRYNGSSYICCPCIYFFHTLYKTTGKLHIILFKRNHSPFLLTFSFVFFFPVFSDVFTFLSTHLAFNFSYLHLFAMANSSFHEGKAFFFPPFLFYHVFSLQCITSKYQKKTFHRMPKFTWILQIFF